MPEYNVGSRSAAITLSLDVYHRDVMDLLKIQHENRDPRLTAFDIFPQLVVNDVFMRRVEANLNWTLLDPKEVLDKTGYDLSELVGDEFEKAYLVCEATDRLRLKTVVKARDIVKEMMRSWVETGLPYVAFKDTINAVNPNKNTGYIPGANLCVESYSNVKAGHTSHVCNLSSLNLSDMSMEEAGYYARICTRMLDNAIELTDFPTEASAIHNDMYRVIGVGVMGLADWIAKEGLTYSSVDDVGDLMETISYNTVVESIQLATERGSFTLFPESEWANGNMIERYATMSNVHNWIRLQDEIDTYGIRNSQLMAIAPNTSTSLIQGCSASVLPVYKKMFFDTNSSGTFPIVAKHIKDRFWNYIEYKNMDNIKMNSMISEIQKWVDTGISYETVFDMNKGITAKDMFNFFMDAWRKKIKTIYYVRIIGVDGSMKDKEECTSCAG